jgi:hypothetical protein
MNKCIRIGKTIFYLEHLAMRWVIWFLVGCMAVSVLASVYMAKHVLSPIGNPPLDAQEKEYLEENRRLIEQLIAADKRHAGEEELENIRKDRREVLLRFYQYRKTHKHGGLLDRSEFKMRFFAAETEGYRMNNLLYLVRWIVAAILLLVATLHGVSVLPSGGNVHPVSEYLRSTRQSEQLRDDQVLLLRSFATQDEIHAGLIDGSLSLREAAAALRTEYESRPAHLRPVVDATEEGYSLLILLQMDWCLNDDPRRSEVLKRLVAEYQAYRDCLTSPEGKENDPCRVTSLPIRRGRPIRRTRPPRGICAAPSTCAAEPDSPSPGTNSGATCRTDPNAVSTASCRARPESTACPTTSRPARRS